MNVIRPRPPIAPRVARYALAATLCLVPRLHVAAQSLPARISDADYWKMITTFSEPNGYFRSDNLVSNEVTFQHVIPDLKKSTTTGGVYLGVGPDQNFTYIVALQPKIAFIVDIRRQNMLQHLLYKSLIEQSKDRADFLAKLFSRPRPKGIDTASTAEALFRAFRAVAPDSVVYRRNVEAIRVSLVDQHKFTLSEDDLYAIEYVYSAFYDAGPDLTYNYPRMTQNSFGSRRMPTYEELMIATDGTALNRGYLGSEANYRILADLQKRNVIVPLVGDFGGDKALRSVAKYLKDNHATVTAFYTSNVEQYLFQSDAWRGFFANLAALPVDSSSTFLRAVFNTGGMRTQTTVAGPRSVTLRASIAESVKAYNEGRILSYFDVIQMSR
jgi:hypothetical protein